MTYLIWIFLIALVFIPPLLIRKKHEPFAVQSPRIPHNEIMEALKILDLPEDAGIEEVKEAHRKLIQQSHPDIGGSPKQASKVNRARDILLKNLHTDSKQAA